MKKKLCTILLSFIMVLGLSISSFAAQNNLSNQQDSSSDIEDFIAKILNQDSVRVDVGTDKMYLDKKISVPVNTDASLIIYRINVDKDTNVTLNYKFGSKTFGIGVSPYDISSLTPAIIEDIEGAISWIDISTDNSDVQQDSVDLKLKKGVNDIAVLSTKGDYEITAKTTGDLKEMKQMKVNEVKKGATTITGTGFKGAEVTLVDPTDKDVKSTTVKDDNTFAIKINEAEEGDSYILTMKKDGYIAQVKIVSVDIVKKDFNNFTVNTVKSTSKYVTGKGESGAEVYIMVGDTLGIGQSTVKSDGTYSVKLPPKPQAGTVLTVIMKKEGYNTKTKNVTIKKVFTKKLTVNTVKSTSTSITGKGSPSATIKAYVGDKKIGETKVSSKGTYSMKIAKQSKGTKITVKMSKTGFATSTKTVTVQ